jgi:large subunit ribosomal protein L12
MQYIYASMVLHSAGADIDEDSVRKVMEAAGIEPDEYQLKSLIESLDGLDIDEFTKLPEPVPVIETEEKQAEDEPDDDEDEDEPSGLTQLFPGMF